VGWALGPDDTREPDGVSSFLVFFLAFLIFWERKQSEAQQQSAGQRAKEWTGKSRLDQTIREERKDGGSTRAFICWCT
jgi:hypothetical protein